MAELTDEQKSEYFHRSFTAADGLWFMKVEERYGFDTALEIDESVWAVVPKIQARMMKTFTGNPSGLDALLEALQTKLGLEGFRWEVRDAGPDGFTIAVLECPWHTKMEQSGRIHLSEKVGRTICSREYAVWAAEYGTGIEFEMSGRVCGGGSSCDLVFTRRV